MDTDVRTVRPWEGANMPLDLSARLSAGIALVLYLVGLGAAFGVRAWLQHRRTGDAGFRIGSPGARPIERLGSALFAAALLLALAGLVLGAIAPQTEWPAWTRWAGLAISLAGLGLVVAAQTSMGSSWRVGVDPSETTALVTGGAFAIVRNPIFSAMGVAMLGATLMSPNLWTALGLAAFIVGVQLQVRVTEEPYLLRTHGDAYRRYASKVGRFVPGLGLLPEAADVSGRAN